jgi:hypothetical protein
MNTTTEIAQCGCDKKQCDAMSYGAADVATGQKMWSGAARKNLVLPINGNSVFVSIEQEKRR